MSLEQRIQKLLPDMAMNQKKLAYFFLANMDLVALLPIKEVAARAGVSEASVVRFGQALGYKGHKELKTEVSMALQHQLSPTERYEHAVEKRSQSSDMLHLVADNVSANIQDTVNAIDDAVFTSVVDAIIKARRVNIIGLELSSHFAALFTFLLKLYAYDAQRLSPEHMKFKEQVAYLEPEDLLIAFSFSPYSRETVEAMAFAQERGITTVAFTDNKAAPMLQHANHCIQIKTDNIMFSNAMGAITVVINAIISELNFRDQDRTRRALKIIEENIKDERYFIF